MVIVVFLVNCWLEFIFFPLWLGVRALSSKDFHCIVLYCFIVVLVLKSGEEDGRKYCILPFFPRVEIWEDVKKEK